jgi:hypothetical protein
LARAAAARIARTLVFISVSSGRSRVGRSTEKVPRD